MVTARASVRVSNLFLLIFSCLGFLNFEDEVDCWMVSKYGNMSPAQQFWFLSAVILTDSQFRACNFSSNYL